jgi:hypothetical protein
MLLIGGGVVGAILVVIGIVVVSSSGDTKDPPPAKTDVAKTVAKTGKSSPRPKPSKTSRPPPRKTPKPPPRVGPDPFKKPPGNPSREAIEELANDAAEGPLSKAWDLADSGNYEEAVNVLRALRRKWPDWMSGTKALSTVKKRLLIYRRKHTFKKRLNEALAEGRGSAKLKRWCKRVLSSSLPKDLAEMTDIVDKFKDDAEKLLGLDEWRKLDLEALDMGDFEKDLAIPPE